MAGSDNILVFGDPEREPALLEVVRGIQVVHSRAHVYSDLEIAQEELNDSEFNGIVIAGLDWAINKAEVVDPADGPPPNGKAMLAALSRNRLPRALFTEDKAFAERLIRSPWDRHIPVTPRKMIATNTMLWVRYVSYPHTGDTKQRP